MSAFLCSSTHVSRIVNAAKQAGVPMLDDETPEVMFDLLVAENRRSLLARYGDDDRDVPMTYEPTATAADPVAVVKLLHSYSYQSCEHDGWDTCAVREWIDGLELRLRLPSQAGRLRDLPEYDRAPWAP
jgi:hypothetical protein